MKARARREIETNADAALCPVSTKRYTLLRNLQALYFVCFMLAEKALYFKSSIFRLEIDSIRHREAEQERLWQIQKWEKGRGMPIKFLSIRKQYVYAIRKANGVEADI